MVAKRVVVNVPVTTIYTILNNPPYKTGVSFCVRLRGTREGSQQLSLTVTTAAWASSLHPSKRSPQRLNNITKRAQFLNPPKRSRRAPKCAEDSRPTEGKGQWSLPVQSTLPSLLRSLARPSPSRHDVAR